MTTPAADRFLSTMWAAIGEDGPAPVVDGPPPPLPSRLHAAELVGDAVAVASLAAASLVGDSVAVRLDPERVATAVTSDRHLRIDGVPPEVWSPASGFFRTRDGWVRTHGNYPHHRARLRAALDLPHAESVDRDVLARRIGELDAVEIERRAAEAGAIAVAVRDGDAWRREPAARSVDAEPLVHRCVRSGGSPARVRADVRPEAPLAGIRVLDLTRVIAGPVATRTLALLGADVLRLDSPTLPEFDWQHADTGGAKRTALLDLTTPTGAATLGGLLDRADVLVTGYRPGALGVFGLEPSQLALTHPALITGRVSAWGEDGPWSGRRGFDSIVQAATGIAMVEGGDEPGALPAQALDHTAGYLLAAALTAAVRRRRHTGEVTEVAVSLVRIAHELLRHGTRRAVVPGGFVPTVAEHRVDGHTLTLAEPALGYEGGPQQWPAPPRHWGADSPTWAD